MPGLTDGFGDDWTPERKGKNGQRSGRITGRPRNRDVGAQVIVDGVPPNREARRNYQKTVTKRADRLHIVLLGGWRKHDTAQQIAHRRSMQSGANDPGDGMTRADRRAEYLANYRTHRKNRLARGR